VTDLSVEQIAARAGFGTAASMRQHLKASLGGSPTEYRDTLAAVVLPRATRPVGVGSQRPAGSGRASGSPRAGAGRSCTAWSWARTGG
jgi:hypothetical protein